MAEEEAGDEEDEEKEEEEDEDEGCETSLNRLSSEDAASLDSITTALLSSPSLADLECLVLDTKASFCACVFLKCVVAKETTTTSSVQITRDIPGSILTLLERRREEEGEEGEEIGRILFVFHCIDARRLVP